MVATLKGLKDLLQFKHGVLKLGVLSTAEIRLFFLDPWLFFVLLLTLNFNMGWVASKNRLANRMVCQTLFVDAPPRETLGMRGEEQASIDKEK